MMRASRIFEPNLAPLLQSEQFFDLLLAVKACAQTRKITFCNASALPFLREICAGARVEDWAVLSAAYQGFCA